MEVSKMGLFNDLNLFDKEECVYGTLVLRGSKKVIAELWKTTPKTAKEIGLSKKNRISKKVSEIVSLLFIPKDSLIELIDEFCLKHFTDNYSIFSSELHIYLPEEKEGIVIRDNDCEVFDLSKEDNNLTPELSSLILARQIFPLIAEGGD